MKILTATCAPMPRENDYCEAITGEICVPHGLVCTNPEKAAECGCERTHLGVSSHKWTTTVAVSETDWTFDELVGVFRDNLTESNWVEVFGADGLDEAATDAIAQSIDVANDHALGTILRPRFDHGKELWFYEEGDTK